MGCIYRRKVKQPDGRVKETPIWWIKYSRNGRPYFESSGSKKHEDAKRLLRLREGDIERGLPVTSTMGRLRFDAATLPRAHHVRGVSSRARSDRSVQPLSSSNPPVWSCSSTNLHRHGV